MSTENGDHVQLSRRAFVKNGTMTLAAAATASRSLLAAENESTLSIGLVTDLHYADKPPVRTRHYRETLDKLAEASSKIAAAEPNFVVELGDFVDAADSVDVERAYLERIEREFSAISKHRHYVLGNHCVDTLTKEEFLGGVEQERSYYSFDAGVFHFVVLDSCFRSDGVPYGRKNSQWTDPNIPEQELEWLRADLGATKRPTIVFAHQRLDIVEQYAVKNAAAVRKVLEAGDVRAVFQGHSHQNDYQEISGIHYCTLVAMIEGSGADNNGYSLLRLGAEGAIQVEGFRKQRNHQWRA